MFIYFCSCIQSFIHSLDACISISAFTRTIDARPSMLNFISTYAFTLNCANVAWWYSPCFIDFLTIEIGLKRDFCNFSWFLISKMYLNDLFDFDFKDLQINSTNFHWFLTHWTMTSNREEKKRENKKTKPTFRQKSLNSKIFVMVILSSDVV